MLLGHVALAVLAQKGFKTDPVTTMAGALFPDVVDKSLCQGLHITPNGRMWAHTLLSLGASTLLVRLTGGKKLARSWAVGYISHLAGDVAGPLPLLYPFASYEFEPSRGVWKTIMDYVQNPSEAGFEIALILLALCISQRG